MAESPNQKWDKQLMDFLKRTGEELKRTGEELRSEAERLLTEMRDPISQARLRQGFQDLNDWARRAGRDAAEMLDSAVKRVESTFERTLDVADSAVRGGRRRAGGAAAKGAGRKKASARAGGRTAARKPRAKTAGRKRPSNPSS